MSTVHFVGRHHDGTRMFVDMRLGTTDRPRASVYHEPVRPGAPTISVSGMTVRAKSRTISSAGQNLADLSLVMHPAPGWTPSDVGTLLRIWREFHLNKMKAGCEHMRSVRATIDHNQVCNVTGFRYGQAWLYRPIPARTLREFRRLMSLPTGDVPAYVR